MRIYSETQAKILEHLSVFQYLTSSQLVSLGVTKTRRGLYPALKKLLDESKPVIGRINYKINPMKGRPEAVHYLTRYGVKLLIQNGTDLLEIKHPKRDNVSFSTDYQHRVWTIDFFIKARMWGENKGYFMPLLNYYFEQSSGSNRNNKNGISLSDAKISVNSGGIGYIVPDGTGVIDRIDKTPIFFLFEQHNGKDTGKFLKQMHGHTEAIKSGSASLKYNVTHSGEHIANRVFCVFENEACLKASKYRLAKSSDFEPFIDFFHFKSNEDLKNKPFAEGWELANGQAVEL